MVVSSSLFFFVLAAYFGGDAASLSPLLAMRFIESHKEVLHALCYPSKHSTTDCKRARMFLFVYLVSAVALSGNFFHFISGWVTTILLQVVMAVLAMIYAFSINDYCDRTLGAMECERACNPLIDAYLALRGIQVLQAIWLRSYVAFFAFSGGLLFCIVWVKRGRLYVDAVMLWREVSRLERDGMLLIAIDVLLIVTLMVVMVFSIIQKYSD